MNELIIDIWGKYKYLPAVSIDGKRVEYQNLTGKPKIYYKTDANKAVVVVTKFLEINSFLWYPMFLLFSLLSLFGLLDFYGERKCLVYNLKFEVELVPYKTEVSVRLLKLKRVGQPAADVSGRTPIRIVKNEAYRDKKAWRRRLLVTLSDFVILVGAVVLLVCVLSGALS